LDDNNITTNGSSISAAKLGKLAKYDLVILRNEANNSFVIIAWLCCIFNLCACSCIRTPRYTKSHKPLYSIQNGLNLQLNS